MTDHVATEDRYFRNPMWPYTEYRGIIYEPGKVARIKMNRPRYLNAQSHAMFGELEDAYDRASEDPECHVIVISGEGPLLVIRRRCEWADARVGALSGHLRDA